MTGAERQAHTHILGWRGGLVAKKSHLEEEFARQLDALGVAYLREQRLIEGRRFRFDFCVPAADLIVECEGGTWSGGRHTSGVGFRNDCEKYNLAVTAGYAVLRYTSDMIKSGDAAKQVHRYLAATCPQTLSEPV